MVVILSIISLIVISFFLYSFFKIKKKGIVPVNYQSLLLRNIPFYQNLSIENRSIFEKKLIEFLGYIHIDGVKTTVSDLDRILVGASAIIPIFYFKHWKYYQLNTVLLYPGTFNKEEFLHADSERDTLGMVGNGPMQGTMILSKPALHAGFYGGNSNTGIHEFVHLIDKEDGDIDGMPEALLNKKNNEGWKNLKEENVRKIMAGESDINPYGATLNAEFLPVVSEYFFNEPQHFKLNHPELYAIMKEMFAVPA